MNQKNNEQEAIDRTRRDYEAKFGADINRLRCHLENSFKTEDIVGAAFLMSNLAELAQLGERLLKGYRLKLQGQSLN